ncbi:hypothetical protein REPUB_Repub04eG0145100 [Reevesia pubescens]
MSEPSSNESGREDNIVELEERQTQKPNLFKNWPLMSTIIVYCVFSLQEMAYFEIFSLWVVSDKKYGGLSFSSQYVGEVLAISGISIPFHVAMMIFSFTVSTYVVSTIRKDLGPLMVTRLSAAISIMLLSCFPYISMLSGVILHLVINCAAILRNTLSVTLFIYVFDCSTAGMVVNAFIKSCTRNLQGNSISFSDAYLEPLQSNPNLEEGFCKALSCRLRFHDKTTASGHEPVGFDATLNSRLSTPTSPRAIKILSWKKAVEYSLKLLHDLDVMCSYPLDPHLESLLRFVVQFQKS